MNDVTGLMVTCVFPNLCYRETRSADEKRTCKINLLFFCVKFNDQTGNKTWQTIFSVYCHQLTNKYITVRCSVFMRNENCVLSCSVLRLRSQNSSVINRISQPKKSNMIRAEVNKNEKKMIEHISLVSPQEMPLLLICSKLIFRITH